MVIAMKLSDFKEKIELSTAYEFFSRIIHFVRDFKVASVALAAAFAFMSLLFSYFVFGYDLDNKNTSVSQDGYILNSDSSFDVEVVVYVAGEVENPGLYTLTDGKRVNDAVSAAGGFTKDASVDSVNTAQKLSDEQYIYIPSKSEVAAMTSDTVTKTKTSDSKNVFYGVVNINSATFDQLKQLDGIGDTVAARIIEYRENGGRFNDKRDIMNIKGIGEKLFEKIKDNITV